MCMRHTSCDSQWVNGCHRRIHNRYSYTLKMLWMEKFTLAVESCEFPAKNTLRLDSSQLYLKFHIATWNLSNCQLKFVYSQFYHCTSTVISWSELIPVFTLLLVHVSILIFVCNKNEKRYSVMFVYAIYHY